MSKRGPILVNRKKGLGLLGAMALGGATFAAGSSAATRPDQNQVQSEQIVQLQAQQEAMRQSQALARQMPPGYPSPPPSSGVAAASTDRIAQLKQLAELKEAGVLTEEEFQQEKQRILTGGQIAAGPGMVRVRITELHDNNAC